MTVSPLSRRKPTSARIEHRERMQAGILQAARELIATQGMDGMTMRKLGDRVGVTAATLYGYFPSREMVLQALLEEKLTTMNAMLRKYGQASEAGVGRLLAYALGYRQFAQAHPDFYDLYICNIDPPRWGDLESDPEPHSEILGALHRELRECMKRGEIRTLDIEILLRLMWSAAHGYISLEKSNCFGTVTTSPESGEAQYLEHIATLLRGFLTSAGVAQLDRLLSRVAQDDAANVVLMN